MFEKDKRLTSLGGRRSLFGRDTLYSEEQNETTTGDSAETGSTRLYVIEEIETGRVKVGISNTPFARFKTLQTGNPSRLKLWGHIKGGRDLEAKIHSFLGQYRGLGEWFAPHPFVHEYLKEVLRLGKAPEQYP